MVRKLATRKRHGRTKEDAVVEKTREALSWEGPIGLGVFLVGAGALLAGLGMLLWSLR